jgi:hypothetical protein
MKFDFWLDLPETLVNLAQDDITKEEAHIALLIQNSKNVSGIIRFISKINDKN